MTILPSIFSSPPSINWWRIPKAKMYKDGLSLCTFFTTQTTGHKPGIQAATEF